MPIKRLPANVLPAIFLLLAIGGYFLPRVPSEAMTYHQAIANALEQSTNWGRQAFVGNTDYPMLPTVALLAAQKLAELCRLDAVRLLCTLCQAWLFCGLIRIAVSTRSLHLLPLPLALAFIPSQLRQGFLTASPDWVAAIPLSIMVIHLLEWYHEQKLRSLVIASVAAGLLVFCGLWGCVLAVAMTAVFHWQFSQINRHAPAPLSGAGAILWAPLVYCIFLWFLWNWLIMGNPLFGLKDLCARMADIQADALSRFLAYGIPLTAVLFFPLLICALKSDLAPIARCLLPLPLVAILCGVAAFALGLNPTALMAFAAVAFILTALVVINANYSHHVPKTCAWATCACCIVLGFRLPLLTTGLFMESQAPDPQEITDGIDKTWPEARVAVYGMRLPALYPDPTERRFTARLDYHEAHLMELSHMEQMFLLVPPPDGYFFPQRHSVFTDIYANGRPWLLLERQWSSGWQLWRAVFPPEDQSLLEPFLPPKSTAP